MRATAREEGATRLRARKPAGGNHPPRVGATPRARTALARRHLAAVGLAGVLALGLGSSDAAAQEVESTGRSVERVDAATDRRIEQRLTNVFGTLEALAAVEVEVESGVVQLSGEAPDDDARRLAATLAKQVEGVVAVENDLREPQGRRRLAAVLDDLRARLAGWLALLPLIGVSILVFLLFAAVARLAGRAERPFTWLTPNVFLRDLARQAARAALVLAGLLLALEILDATTLVGAVLGTAGVLGLAVGFAFRDLAENYIASVLLSLRRPFAPNDHVVVEGREGRVLRLTPRATTLLGFDGNHIRIPNAAVFKGTIVNFTRKPERRFEFAVGLGADQDVATAQALAAETLHDLPGVLAAPEPFAIVESLGDSTVDLRVFGWVDQRETDFGRMRSEAIRRVKEAFDRAGLDMPEPIHRVRVEPASAEPEAPPPDVADAPALDTSAEAHLEQEILAERAGEEPDLLSSAGRAE